MWRRVITTLGIVFSLGAVGAGVLTSGCGTRADAPPEATASSGGEPTPRPAVEPSEDVDETLNHLPRIDDMATWLRLADRPESVVVARTETVKFVIDLQAGGRVYFAQSTRWDLHYAFVRSFIDPTQDHARFNIEQYRRPDRRFICGSLMRYLDGGHWTVELVAGDNLDGARIAETFERLRPLVFFGDQMRFRPLSPLHERSIAGLGDRLPVLSSEEVNAGVRYQPLVLGEALGYLRVVRGPLDFTTLRPNDIVVADHVPGEIPPVSALVTAQLQAPLAHVAVLSRNRNTPDMALRGAHDDARFTALDGQLVHLVVGAQDFTLERAGRDEAEQAWAAMRPARVQTPRRDLRVTQLRDICDVDHAAHRYMGAKAAQLGDVCQLGGALHTPGGFAVPFAHYDAHLRASGQADVLRSMLRDAGFRRDPNQRAARLSALRDAIAAHPIDPTLLREVRARMRRISTSRRFIFRSSSNAEDLPGFNGAGLYESVVVSAGAPAREVADALRRVWASVWLTRAFEEREWYRVAHADVAMAVLVQPFVDDVIANGVAITANPFDEARPAVFINAQTADGSVTGAAGDELPEQYLVYTWSGELEAELLGRSSRGGGAPILTEADAHTLTRLLQRINRQLLPRYESRQANAMDVEFLLTREPRRFVIVQARPHRIRYEAGQRWGR